MAKPAPRFWRSLYFWVVVGIAAGALLGWLWPHGGQALKPLGDGFVKLVRMIITPVIFLTVVTGIAGMRDLKAFGRVGAKAMAYFLTVSTLALGIGLAVANLVHPGAGLNVDPATLDAHAVATYVAQAHDESVTGFLLNIIPATLVSAFTEGEILQVLLVAILFGIAPCPARLRGRAADRGAADFDQDRVQDGPLVDVRRPARRVRGDGLYDRPIWRRRDRQSRRFGRDLLRDLAPVRVDRPRRHRARRRFLDPRAHFLSQGRAAAGARHLLVGKRAAAAGGEARAGGCPESVVGLVVPAGYSFNLDGTCIYMSLAALFIAQACNIPLSFGDQVLLMAVAILSSRAPPGSPARASSCSPRRWRWCRQFRSRAWR